MYQGPWTNLVYSFGWFQNWITRHGLQKTWNKHTTRAGTGRNEAVQGDLWAQSFTYGSLTQNWKTKYSLFRGPKTLFINDSAWFLFTYFHRRIWKNCSARSEKTLLTFLGEPQTLHLAKNVTNKATIENGRNGAQTNMSSWRIENNSVLNISLKSLVKSAKKEQSVLLRHQKYCKTWISNWIYDLKSKVCKWVYSLYVVNLPNKERLSKLKFGTRSCTN